MATWEDGPEYAPLERPLAFVAPEARPLEAAPQPVDLAAGAPIQPPAGYQPPSAPTPPLQALVPSSGEKRDPQRPFAVATALVTAGPAAAQSVSAWGSAHSSILQPSPAQHAWSAEQPMASQWAPPAASAYPTPGTPGWFGPSQYAVQPRSATPATLPNAARAAGVGLLVTLAVGGLVYVVSPIVLIIATALTSQLHYRRRLVRPFYFVAIGLMVLVGIVPLINDGFGAMWTSMGIVGLLACWVLALVTLLMQYLALDKQEPPEQTW